jgi:hypothetical protein
VGAADWALARETTMLLARTPANSITVAPEITLWLIIVKDILFAQVSG